MINQRVYLLLYVDDLITGPDVNELSEIRNVLMLEFEMSDLAIVNDSYFLGIRIQ